MRLACSFPFCCCHLSFLYCTKPPAILKTVAMETAGLANRSPLVKDPKTKCVLVTFSQQVPAGFSSTLASACHSCAGRARSCWRPNMGCNVFRNKTAFPEAISSAQRVVFQTSRAFLGNACYSLSFVNNF